MSWWVAQRAGGMVGLGKGRRARWRRKVWCACPRASPFIERCFVVRKTGGSAARFSSERQTHEEEPPPSRWCLPGGHV